VHHFSTSQTTLDLLNNTISNRFGLKRSPSFMKIAPKPLLQKSTVEQKQVSDPNTPSEIGEQTFD
jgi:hypothetical protein